MLRRQFVCGCVLGGCAAGISSWVPHERIPPYRSHMPSLLTSALYSIIVLCNSISIFVVGVCCALLFIGFQLVGRGYTSWMPRVPHLCHHLTPPPPVPRAGVGYTVSRPLTVADHTPRPRQAGRRLPQQVRSDASRHPVPERVLI